MTFVAAALAGQATSCIEAEPVTLLLALVSAPHALKEDWDDIKWVEH